MYRIDRHGSIVNQEKHDLFKPMLKDGTKKKKKNPILFSSSPKSYSRLIKCFKWHATNEKESTDMALL